MSTRQPAVLAVVLVVGLWAAACGGDGQEAADDAAHPIPSGVVARADRNCRWMLREVQRIGRRASQGEYKSGFELTTEAIAKPGLTLITHLARRQRALRAAADAHRFDAYLSLFDPILVLGEERLEAGEEGNQARSKRLQELLIDLGAEQRQAAAQAGLRDCEVDLFDIVVREAFD